MVDPVKNFGIVTVSTGYDDAATSIVLSTGHGLLLPDPVADGAYDLVWYDGNANLSDGGDIGDTFVFGDDFLGTSLDSKWYQSRVCGTTVVSGSIVSVTGAGSPIYWNSWQAKNVDKISIPFIFEARTQFVETGTTNSKVGVGDFSNTYLGTNFVSIGYNDGSLGSEGKTYFSGDGVSESYIARTVSYSSYKKTKMVITSGNVAYYDDDVFATNKTNNIPSVDLGVGFGDAWDYSIDIDWVFIRKYIANEPTVSVGTAQHQRKVAQFVI